MSSVQLSDADIFKLRRSRSGHASYLTRLYNEIDTLMNDFLNLEDVRKRKSDLEMAFKRFNDSHDEYMEALTDDDDKEEAEFFFHSRVKENKDFEVLIDDWVKRAFKSKEEPQEVKPVDKVDDAVARLRLNRKQKELELERKAEELKLAYEQEMLKLDYDLELTKLGAHESSDSEWHPSKEYGAVGVSSESTALLESMNKMVGILSEGLALPKCEIKPFDGNPLDYLQFISDFKFHVETKTPDNGRRLALLVQHCQGDARKSIEVCKALSPEQGYAEALKLLERRYGHPYVVSQAYLNKVTSGSPIRSNDGRALQEMASDLRNCQITLSSLGYTADLNANVTLRKIVERLSFNLKSKWVDLVGKMRENGSTVTFETLVNFVEQRARYMSDPVFGPLLVKDGTSKARSDRFKGIQRKVTTYASVKTSAAGEVKVQKKMEGSVLNNSCFNCSGPHSIFACPEYKWKTPLERKELALKKRLCFNCLSPHHTSRGCWKPKQCHIRDCGLLKKHHSTLHIIEEENEPTQPLTVSPGRVEVNIQRNNFQTEVYFQVLPVIIEGRDGQMVTTHAVLDGASDICVCSLKLLKKLKFSEKEQDLSVKTLGGWKMLKAQAVDLTVRSMDKRERIDLPKVWGMAETNITGKRVPKKNDLKDFSHLRDLDISEIDGYEIDLLIGANVPEAFVYSESRAGKLGEPIAFKGLLGWSILGGGRESNPQRIGNTHFTQISSDIQLMEKVERLWSLEAMGCAFDDSRSMSLEDRRALDIMEKSAGLVDGHYRIKLPWRRDATVLENNKRIAETRLRFLKQKFVKHPDTFKAYQEVIEDYVKKGYARVIPEEELSFSSPVWYLPHHAVVNPKKPGKVRVVFDCAARFKGISLNDELLSGPDLTNSLAGVLLRFREDEVAITADIEAMFHQVKVYPVDYDVLRFLWWKDGDIESGNIVELQMTVHLFGATSSPSCATFALRKTADDGKEQFPSKFTDAVVKNFYVDDFLKSVPSVSEALEYFDKMTDLLRTGGFNLTKWNSNNKDVLAQIPSNERAKSLLHVDLQEEDLPGDMTLGVRWNTASDSFELKNVQHGQPVTRRGVLSLLSSVFDPLGFLCPFVLKAKTFLQSLVKMKLGWDEEIPEEYLSQWTSWLKDFGNLDQVFVSRCVKPAKYGQIVRRELHHFCDASEKAFGCASYLRLTNADGKVHCILLFAKARLAPLKTQTIPRLELQAAVTAVRVNKLLVRESDHKFDRVIFWTDSTSVLHFLGNEKRRFQVFVANRVAEIRSETEVEQWRYVSTTENVGDFCSRETTLSKLVNEERWFAGPPFLWQSEEEWPHLKTDIPELPPDHAEVKREANVNSITHTDSTASLERLIEHFSSWYRLKKAAAWMLRFKAYLRHKFGSAKETPVRTDDLSLEEISQAETALIKYVQRVNYLDELTTLKAGKQLSKRSKLRPLNPRLEDEVIVVGGRLDRSKLPNSRKHPILLPGKYCMSRAIITEYHKINGHVGRNHVLNLVRSRFWITTGKTVVRSVISRCLTCRRWNQPLGQQKMSDLPTARTTPGDKVFSKVGVDYFGPIYVKQGRSRVKRYGCIFTCMNTRAIHLEIAHQLDSDSFLCAFRRFVSRRGEVLELYSDNGKNFVGAEREMKNLLAEWNQSHIENYLKQRDVKWFFIPASAPHMGGAWERLIRQVKRVLYVIMGKQVVNDESLLTFITEVEYILNSRPLTECSDDVSDHSPLTPNHFLLVKPSVHLSPGVFSRDEVSRKRWRQVQNMVDSFWKRWQREYLSELQCRQKWRDCKNNIQVGDLVLVANKHTHRGRWPLARVVEVLPGEDGLVRHVHVQTSEGSILSRPVVKLCLLEGS